MDDVKLGFRLFLKQKITWLIFILGVASFCCVNYIILASTFHINLDRPHWVLNTDNLFTLGALSPSGKLEPITEQRLQNIKQQGFVEDFALIGKNYTADFRIGNYKFTADSVIYSDNLFSFLQLKGMSDKSEGVWISYDFWLNELDSMQVKGAFLNIDGSKRSYPIAGVLPADIRLQNPLPNTLWLPKIAQNDVLKVNFTTPIPEPLLNDFKSKLSLITPQWYGIFTSAPWRTRESVQKDLDKLSQTGSNTDGITVYSRELPTHLIEGFYFRPEQKAALQQLLIISTFMACAIGIVVLLSLMSQYWNNMISRKHEFDLRIALGGQPWPLFFQLIKEQSFFIVLVLISTALMIGFSHNVLLQTILQDTNSPLNLILISLALTIFVFILTLFLCLSIPLGLFFKTNNLFTRIKTGQLTPKQRTFINFNMLFQAMIALFLISIAYGTYLSTIKIQNSLTINTAIRQVKLSTEKNSLDWRMVFQHLQEHGLADKVALISEAMIQPRDRSVSVSSVSVEDPAQQVITAYFVSSNFMQFMGLNSNNVNENSIWFNNAAVVRLFGELNSNNSVYIKDLPLKVTNPNAGLPIAGIIDNLPHFGLLHQKTPIAYLPYSQALSIISGATILYNPEQEEIIKQLLQSIRVLYGAELKIESLGSISEQLSKSNKLEIALMTSVLWLSVIMMFIIALSFYSLLDAETRREEGTFGVQLAMGADALSLMMIRYRLIGRLYLAASTFWLIMALSLDNWLKSSIAVELLHWRNYIISSLVMMLVLCISSSLPIYKLQRKSIYELVKV